MHTTTAQNPKPRALFRAWTARVTYRECGTVTGISTYTVTMSRAAGGFIATVNGKEVDVKAAARILESAEADKALTVTAEILDTPAPAPERLGKAAAYELHRELGRLRFRDHYATASEALGVPVSSLAALTAEEANTVRSYARGSWGLPA